jgi:LAO/AO transport system kinase
MDLAKKVIKGDIRAVARLIRNIDDGVPDAIEELKKIYPKTGNAHIIGITGSPGVGKSTLVDKVIKAFRKDSKTVGIIALDPTSPFTGGAILGDRIRMQDHSLDKGVFIRSLATRGCLGGLSYSTNAVIKVMDAMGKDIIIIETVGVGQSEVEIVNSCHTSIVVLSPGLGDDVQMIKAGILEIGDIFVINKSDKDGAEKVENDLRVMIGMNQKSEDGWKPPIYKTVATMDKGVKDLIEGIYQHKTRLFSSKEMEAQIKGSLKLEFLKILQTKLMAAIMKKISEKGLIEKIVDDLYNKSKDPYSMAEEVIKKF